MSELARATLSVFGSYEHLLPDWMRQPGIRTYVAEVNGRQAGIAMLGFFEDPERGLFADLLALAVAPAFQTRGLGRTLLRHVISQARQSARQVTELRLSVADSNDRARALFESEGFVLRPYELGTYERGQVALRMALPLSLANSEAA